MRMTAMAMLVAIGVAGAARGEEIFCDKGVVSASWTLLKRARFGFGREEAAGFVVRDAGGALSLVLWPASGEALAAHYDGALPPRTVAIVHTHPMDHPMPSADDQATARRLGIPVYVLMRTGVTRTRGAGNETLLLGDWNPATRPDRQPAACRTAVAALAK